MISLLKRCKESTFKCHDRFFAFGKKSWPLIGTKEHEKYRKAGHGSHGPAFAGRQVNTDFFACGKKGLHACPHFAGKSHDYARKIQRHSKTACTTGRSPKGDFEDLKQIIISFFKSCVIIPAKIYKTLRLRKSLYWLCGIQIRKAMIKSICNLSESKVPLGGI